jgi:hypothetical protein
VRVFMPHNYHGNNAFNSATAFNDAKRWVAAQNRRETIEGIETPWARRVFRPTGAPFHVHTDFKRGRAGARPRASLQLIILRSLFQGRIKGFAGLVGRAVFVNHLLYGFGNVIDHITPVNRGQRHARA